MKTKDKIILAVFFIAAYFIVSAMINKANAQSSNNAILLVGYKSVEIGYTVNDEESLNFGFSLSAVDSKLVEKRANRNDVNRHKHDFKGSLVPSTFWLVGGTFDKITLTGKVGASYIDQLIDEIEDKKKMYFAVGLIISRQINERFSVSGSYDNVNSATIGLTYKI